MSDLQQEFDELERAVRETIGLLEEVEGQKYWLIMFRRALLSIEAKELAGATSVLSCFGGEATFSDLRLEQSFKENVSRRSAPEKFSNMQHVLAAHRKNTPPLMQHVTQYLLVKPYRIEYQAFQMQKHPSCF